MNIKFFFVLAFDHLFLISFFFFLLIRTFADLQTLINQFVQLFFSYKKQIMFLHVFYIGLSVI